MRYANINSLYLSSSNNFKGIKWKIAHAVVAVTTDVLHWWLLLYYRCAAL